MTWERRRIWTSTILSIFLFTGCLAKPDVRVGAKAMPESVILAHIASFVIADEGLGLKTTVEELGGTEIVWSALESGRINIYPEYIGTLRQQILKNEDIQDDESLIQTLAHRGIGMTKPLGFENGYALGMTQQRASQLKIEKISDLIDHPTLRLGFSSEFVHRADSWPGLKSRYRLPLSNPMSMEHSLTYQAITSGSVDVIDLYTTDAEIRRLRLVPLEDDLGYFPNYQAVFLYRLDLVTQHPHVLLALDRLVGKISPSQMIEMNSEAIETERSEHEIASNFVTQQLQIPVTTQAQSSFNRLFTLTLQHLGLVFISLLSAIVTAVPLGMLAYRRPRLGTSLLSAVGIIQTIPTLAMLVFMIPIFGLGALPAIGALYLYSLLPILRNTVSGLQDVPISLREASDSLGLNKLQLLRLIELPVAARSIMAGIKTAAVINVGTATLGALIGAGGLGQMIQEGLRLNDKSLILMGAIPAALLAIIVQAVFECLERAVVPPGLRIEQRS